MLYQMIYDLICIAVENSIEQIHGLMRPPPFFYSQIFRCGPLRGMWKNEFRQKMIWSVERRL
jgi:hypothetical protein